MTAGFWVFEGLMLGAASFGFSLMLLHGYPRKTTLPVPQDGIKYCRDCRWCLPGRGGLLNRRTNYGLARCGHITSAHQPAAVLVEGLLSEDNMSYCEIARK